MEAWGHAGLRTLGEEMTLDEAIEKSKEAFEIYLAKRRWDGTFEDCKSGTFEQNLSGYKTCMVWDEAEQTYKSAGRHGYQDPGRDWELWKAAVEHGYEEATKGAYPWG